MFSQNVTVATRNSPLAGIRTILALVCGILMLCTCVSGVVFVLGSPTPPGQQVLSPIVCEPGATLTAVTRDCSDMGEPGTCGSFVCVSPEGSQRSATTLLFMWVGAICLPLLLIPPLLLFIPRGGIPAGGVVLPGTITRRNW